MADDLEREEEQVEETQEPQPSTEPTDDDDLDIDLGPTVVAQSQSGGCRTTTIVLFVLLLIVAAASIIYIRHVQEVRRAEMEARLEREEQYKAWMGHVVADVSEAIDKAEAGQMGDALALLERAEAKLTTIGTHANDANDQQWAAFVMSKKSTLLEAKNAIATEYERYQQAVDEVLTKLGSKFGGADLGAGVPDRPAAPAAEQEPLAPPDEPAPGESPGMTEEVAEPHEAPEAAAEPEQPSPGDQQ